MAEKYRLRRGLWQKSPIKVFVTATNVRTGRGRVFRNADLTPEVLLASACLPTMFQAVEIDGESLLGWRVFREPHHDASHHANARSSDTIFVPINPVERPGTPDGAREISTGSTKCPSTPSC